MKCFFTECDIIDVFKYILVAFEKVNPIFYIKDTWRISLNLYKMQSHKYKFFVERELIDGFIGDTFIIVKDIDSQNAFKFAVSELATTNTEYGDTEIMTYLNEVIYD